MDLVSYEGMYESPYDGLMHYIMPPDLILVASTLSQNKFMYAKITQTEQDRTIADYQAARVPQYVTDPATDQLLFRLWSRPLPCPGNTLSWAVAKVTSLVSQPLVLVKLVIHCQFPHSWVLLVISMLGTCCRLMPMANWNLLQTLRH